MSRPAPAGSVQSYADEKSNILSDHLSWWEHAEALRALMHWALVRNESQYLEPFGAILDFVKTRFLDPDHGGWFRLLERDGSPRDTTKGTGWKLDYHQVALCREAVQSIPKGSGLRVLRIRSGGGSSPVFMQREGSGPPRPSHGKKASGSRSVRSVRSVGSVGSPTPRTPRSRWLWVASRGPGRR